MRKAFYLLFAPIFFLTGCSLYHVDSQETALDSYAPKVSAEQVVYQENIERTHEVIGVVSVTADRARPLEDIIDIMKGEAAMLGGDAITEVHSGPAAPVAGHGKSSGLFANAAIRLQYSAKVIAFK